VTGRYRSMGGIIGRSSVNLRFLSTVLRILSAPYIVASVPLRKVQERWRQNQWKYGLHLAGTTPPKHAADREATTPLPPLAEALWAIEELAVAAEGPEDGRARCAQRLRALVADLAQAELASLRGSSACWTDGTTT